MLEVLGVPAAHERVLSSLKLNECCTTLHDMEALAALVRRAASLSCPCPPRVIRQRVGLGVRGLVDPTAVDEERIGACLDAVTAYGDLLELPSRDEEDARNVLYLAPPAFVETAPGIVYLVGIQPEGQGMVPGRLSEMIEYSGVARRMRYSSADDLPNVLKGLGLQAMLPKLWFQQPRAEQPKDVISRYDAQLAQRTTRGDLSGLEVLDTSRNPLYYRGRWSAPGRLSGRFVGRRVQTYGAPLWVYVELDMGTPTLLLDLHSQEWSSCDEAWRLQMAIDAVNGKPQQFRADLVEGDKVIVRLFSPVPSWWQRRWNVLGRRVDVERCLMAYELSLEQYCAELTMLTDELWLRERTDTN